MPRDHTSKLYVKLYMHLRCTRGPLLYRPCTKGASVSTPKCWPKSFQTSSKGEKWVAPMDQSCKIPPGYNVGNLQNITQTIAATRTFLLLYFFANPSRSIGQHGKPTETKEDPPSCWVLLKYTPLFTKYVPYTTPIPHHNMVWKTNIATPYFYTTTIAQHSVSIVQMLTGVPSKLMLARNRWLMLFPFVNDLTETPKQSSYTPL